ncbi:MAG: dipeptidase [Acetatifactor sp.]|nr:dipeptidase [Acetatifactor sp.]
MRVVDMHCDTVSVLLQKEREGKQEKLFQNNGHLDIKRMREQAYLLQNFALFVHTPDCIDAWEEVCALYELYTEQMEENSALMAPVLCYEDIEKNESVGKISALLTVEEGAVCKGKIDKLDKLYQMGVRMLTLTWNFPNELGYPNLNMAGAQPTEKNFSEIFFTPDVTHGLTEKGIEFVQEMERLGMIPDVSHLSDAGFYDVLTHTKKPFVASHSNARAVCGCVRNMTDDMIRKLSERGGCMGLNFCADFLREVPFGEKNSGSIEDVVAHAKHIAKVGGVEVLGLGSDFDGIDTNEGLPGVQSMGRLWEALHDGGFKASEVDKIFSENVLRVYRDTL